MRLQFIYEKTILLLTLSNFFFLLLVDMTVIVTRAENQRNMFKNYETILFCHPKNEAIFFCHIRFMLPYFIYKLYRHSYWSRG